MKKAARILIVEDIPTDAELAEREICKVLKGCTFHLVETRKDFLKALETFQPDVILSDYTLSNFDGITALKLARKHAPFTPSIIWTGFSSEDIAVNCLKAGANNYVLKENIKQLGPAVVHALAERKLLLARKQAEEKCQTIFENSVVGIFQSTPKGRYRNVNAAMARIYGYASPNEMIKAVKNITQQIYVDASQRSEFVRLLDSQNTVEHYEARNYRKDRNIIWTSTSARTVRDSEGNVLYYEGFITDITARKEMEEELKERERQLTILFGNLPGPVYRRRNDENYTMDFISDGIRELSGYPADDFQQRRRDYGKLIHPQDQERVWAEIQAAMERNQPFELTYRIVTASGGQRWVWEKGQGVYDATGQLQALEGFITDISARKHAEEAIQNREKHFRALIENGLDNISLLAADGTLLWESPATSRTLDYTPDMFVGRNIFELMHPDDFEWTRALYVKLVQEPGSRQQGVFRLRHSSGAWRWVEAIVTNMLNEPSVNAMVVNYRDVTERRLTEEALLESQFKYQNLVETSHDLIWSIDAEGRFTFVNGAAKQIYGYEPEELLGRSFFEVLDPEYYQLEDFDKFREMLAPLNEYKEFETHVRHRDGRKLVLSANSIVIHDQEGQVIGMTGSSRDITLRKRVEEVLKEERNLLRTLIDNLPDRIYAMDVEGRKTLSNTADWQASGGKTMEDVLGKTDFDTYPPDLAEVFWGLDQAVLESGQAVINYEEPGLDAEGNRVAILTTKIPLRDDEGKVTGLVGIGRDITERKQVEERINDLLAFNEKMLNHSAVGIITYKVSGPCVFANEKAASIVGTTVAQLLAQNFHTIEAWQRSGLYDLVEKAITSLSPTTADIHHVSSFGKDVWMTVHCITFKSKGEDHVLLSLSDITERKDAEEKLRHSENRYRLAIKATNDVIWESNLQTKQLFWSENAQIVFGYSPEEVASDETWWDDHLHPDDRERVLSKVNSLIEGDESLWMDEYRFQLKNGSYAYIGDRGYIERDANGTALRMIGAMTDITERKQAEEKLRESENRLFMALSGAQMSVWEWDLKTNQILWSPEFFKIAGVDEEQFTGTFESFTDLIHPDDVDRVRKAAEQAMQKQTMFAEEFRIIFPNSEVRWLSNLGQAEYDSTGSYLRLIGTVQDVTQRKQAEEALRQSQNRYRTLVETQTEFIVRWKPDGTRTFANEAYCRYFGLTPEQALSSFMPLIHEEDHPSVEDKIRRLLSGASSVETEVHRVIKPDGSIGWQEWTDQTICDENGNVVELQSVGRDVTERRQAEIERQALLEIMQGFANTEDLHELLELIHRSIARVIYAENFFVVLYEQNTGLFEEIYSADQYDPPEPPSKLENSITSYVFRSGEPLLLTQVLFDELVKQGEMQLVGTNSASWLGVPLKTSGRTIGVMAVQDYEIDNRYSERDKNFLASIATQVALAIERKQAEESLRAEREKMQNYLDIAGVMMLALDQEGTVTLINQKGCEILGYSADQIVGKNWINTFLPESDRQELREVFQKHITGGIQAAEYYENPVLTKHGEERLIAWHNTVVRDKQGKIISTLSSGEDITERKRAEEALREAETKYRTLVEQLPSVTYLAVIDENIRYGEFNTSYISPQVENLLGYPPHAFESDPGLWTRLIHPEDRERFIAKIADYYKNQGFYTDEYRMRTQKGNEIWVRDEAIIVHDKRSNYPFSQGVLFDITERKRMEVAEREQRALAEALRDTAEILSSTLDYGEVLDHILTTVGRVVPHDAATIMLIEGEFARVVRSQGYNQRGFSAELIGMRLPIAETSNLQQILTSGQPEVVSDTWTYDGWKKLSFTDWLRSDVGAPISIYGRVIGFILLDSGTPGFFTSVHAERLQAFANQAALAIHNARLLQQAQEEIVERKRAEEALRFEKERFESIAATVPGIICSFRLHPDGTACMPFASTAIQEVYGLLPADVQQDAAPLFERLHPDDVAHVQATIDESARTMLPWHDEYRYQHPIKGEIWIEGQSMPLRQEDGSMIWHGFVHDVTERKRAEQELRASEERFRQLADNIQEVFWMTDAESGEEIYMSPAAEAVWAQPIDRLMHEPNAFLKTVFPEDLPLVLQNIEKEKNGEKVEIEYRIRRPDGSLRWIWDRAFPIFDDSGKVKRIAGISADITERRESELALVKSQSRYRELFDSSPVSIWEEDFSLVKQRVDGLLKNGVTDLKEYFSRHEEQVIELASLVTVTDANQASLELYRVERKEDLLKSLTQAVGVEALAHFREEILGLLGPQKKFVWEGSERGPDGRQVELIVTGSIPHGYEEDWAKVIISIIDVTERKQAENEIRRRAEENSILLKTSLALTNLDLKATLQTVGDSAKNLFAADGCRIFLMEPEGKSLRCVLALQESLTAFSDLRIKIGEGVTGAVAASGLGEIVNEMQNDPRSMQVTGTPEEEEAIMFAPLKERDNTIGVLSVRRTGKDRPFQPADLALLEALASMAASAVSNARLFAETQRRLSELEALYENGLAVGRLLKPNQIGNRLINTFSRYLPWHHVTIRLRQDGSDNLELVAFSLPNLQEEERTNAEHHFIARINKVGQGLSGEAIQTGVPLRTGNVQAHPQYIDTHAGIQSGLYMPLKVGERVIGVISVESEAPDAFTEQDERLLATLASQAAIAFENARLYQKIEQELSERKRAQEALLISETHYRELADSITDILFELDHDLRYTHWNKASEMFAGISAEDTIGRSMTELFEASEEQSRREEIYKNVLRERQARTFETEVVVKGQKRSLEINAYPSARGVSVVAKDVTDRKRSEIIMQKRFELMEYSSHHSLDELMQRTVDEVSELTGSMIGFFHFVQEDQNTLGLQTWSTNALQLFNVPLSLGGHLALNQAGVWADAVHQRRPLIQNDYEALTDKKGLPQGHVPIAREIVIPIIRNEKVMAIMGIGNKAQEYTSYDLEVAERLADYAWDITERKQMQVALEMERNQLAKRVEERTSDLSRANSNLARALRVKDEFLANMSHELRTPLNAILGLSESLGEQIAGPLNEKQQKYITTISESGHHLLSLINDILDLAKIEANQITLDINKVDVQQVCQASLRMIKQLAQKKNQDVVLEIGDGVGLMWADERRLKQMIVNLLGNAVKFTPEYGKIGLEVHGDQVANKVTITVWDNGIGIKEVDLARLFQPFVQLDSGLAREATGTGLGLALVAQMARLHGGSVTAVSEAGKGSRFSIILPWESGLAMDASSRLRTTGKFPAIKPDETNKLTILLVEDTKEVVMMIRDYLELAGYKVVTAQDGVEALAQARLVHPDLILMDVMMPRMDGFEATRKLRSEPEFKHTPIVALTALAMPSDRERCLAAGMDEYISKPINLKALVRIIQSCLFGNEESKRK